MNSASAISAWMLNSTCLSAEPVLRYWSRFCFRCWRRPGYFSWHSQFEGVPEIDFNNFAIGVPSRPNELVENIYQVLDNYSKVIGTHTIKFGGQYHYNQLEENLSNVANGNFFFGTGLNGGTSETGSDFVGLPAGCTEFIHSRTVLSLLRPKFLFWPFCSG